MPELRLSRRRALVALALAVGAVVLLGHVVSSPGAAPARVRSDGALRREPAQSRQLVVHVVGAVRAPGLYRLKDGSRVADAVARAGGATADADLALVNLAAPLADGLQVVVPAAAPTAMGETGSTEGAGSGPVHLNTATLEQLDALPGVGPSTAQRILEYRAANGAFTRVEELDAVPGIGPARLEQLRELVAP